MKRIPQDKWDELIRGLQTSGLQAPKQILFGRHSLDRIESIIRDGPRVLLMTGVRSSADTGLLPRIETLLRNAGVSELDICRDITGEPTPAMVMTAVERARTRKPDLIVSLGGGSVIDGAKAVAALATNEGSVEEYLEGVGHRQRLEQPPRPHLAIPTVAGTGAEMTKNAVIGLPERGLKRSMRFDVMIPTAAIIDPVLTLTVSPRVTAHGGMDAITQLIEPCISAKKKPATTALAHEGLRWARSALTDGYAHPHDLDAREAMSLASLLSGVCLANAGLAMVHGLAAAMGALLDQPHGLLCGVLLPHALRYNRAAAAEPLREALAAFMHRDPADPAVLDDGLSTLEAMNQQFQIPPDLKFLSLTPPLLERIAQNAAGSSMSGNPVPMTPDLTLKFLQAIS